MDFKRYQRSLGTQKAELRETIREKLLNDEPLEDSADLLQMLGMVEMQLGMVKKRILTENKQDFDFAK
ncbi:hypothetical protein [Flavobacterium sp.]|uniref:hypothetical protein n=1 Tax=Flavobacterium sp. TaxID=239 RepID=UPI001222BEBC|nr:hypothetical protein [Flavobacterium sp.]RZJ71073.1 MAG: hypothetical protein EOO49_11510 [Flavobacterium sp.]